MMVICEGSDCDFDDGGDDVSGAACTPKHQRLAREEALEQSLAFGLYL